MSTSINSIINIEKAAPSFNYHYEDGVWYPTPSPSQQISNISVTNFSGQLSRVAGSYYEIDNASGFAGIAFTAQTSGTTVQFQSTFDGSNWSNCILRRIGNDGYLNFTNQNDSFIGSIAGARKFRVYSLISGSGDVSIAGTLQKYVNTLEGIENGPPNDFELNMAEGKIAGYDIVNKFGRNPDISTATTPEDIWNGGGIYSGFPVGFSGEPVRVYSTSALDTLNGVGGRTLRIVGLDRSYQIQNEDFNLSGVSYVTGTKNFVRVHSASILTAGSNDFNVGQIAVEPCYHQHYRFLYMPSGRNQSNNVGYTVPSGKTAYLRKIHGNIRGSNQIVYANGSIWLRESGKAPRLRRPFTISNEAPLQDVIYGGLSFPAGTDITIRIETSSANNLDITAGYDLVLVDN